MKVNELSRAQKIELKQHWISEFWLDNPTWEDMASADYLVTDEEIEYAYGDVDFVEEDFLGCE